MKKIELKRRFRYQGMAKLFAVVLVIILLLINTIVGLLSDRFNCVLDLTDNQIYGLSEETEGYLESLEQDIEIYVLS
ncbi:MAG: GldG family protein, partial [Lachnospiraceae bacterium]|nr:GldG family protein [Lachnospiraceae bacterium]